MNADTEAEAAAARRRSTAYRNHIAARAAVIPETDPGKPDDGRAETEEWLITIPANPDPNQRWNHQESNREERHFPSFPAAFLKFGGAVDFFRALALLIGG